MYGLLTCAPAGRTGPGPAPSEGGFTRSGHRFAVRAPTARLTVERMNRSSYEPPEHPLEVLMAQIAAAGQVTGAADRGQARPSEIDSRVQLPTAA